MSVRVGSLIWHSVDSCVEGFSLRSLYGHSATCMCKAGFVTAAGLCQSEIATTRWTTAPWTKQGEERHLKVSNCSHFFPSWVDFSYLSPLYFPPEFFHRCPTGQVNMSDRPGHCQSLRGAGAVFGFFSFSHCLTLRRCFMRALSPLPAL